MIYQELAIYKGYTTPGNAGEVNVNENTPDSINLLDAGKGFGVKPGGWIPQFSQLKNGGVFAENPLSDNDVYLFGSKGKVTQTITLHSAVASPEGRYWLESKLRLFSDYAGEFHYTLYQTDPVYLKWFAPGAPGPQYSLIYTIQIAQNREPFDAPKSNELTITITHQAEWWPIPPGSNPQQYVIDQYGVGGSGNPLALLGGVSTVSGYIRGCTIIGNSKVIATDGGWGGPYQNFIDIPASKIPGDAPALVLITFDAKGYSAAAARINTKQTIMLARRSRGLSLKRLVSGSQFDSLAVNTWPVDIPAVLSSAFPGFLATLGTDATLEADNGCYGFTYATSNFVGSNTRQRLKVTFGTLTDSIRLTWTADMTTFSGRWHAFLRCFQSGGTLGAVSMYLQYGYDGNDAMTTPVSPTLQTVAANTGFWPVVDMGIITLPPDNARMAMNNMGNAAGILGDTGALVKNDNLDIRLRASRTGASGTLYVADLVLMPIDEKAALISFEGSAGLNSNFDNDYTLLDTTQHVVRGVDSMFAAAYDADLNAPAYAGELSGPDFTLRPGVDNRIYFLSTSDAIGTASPTLKRSMIINPSDNVDIMPVNITVIPRWYGVRSSK